MAAVEVARDWLDYVEALGAIGSLVLAIVAAVFAWRSANDSSRSARAAEETAEAATEEAALSRQMVKRLEEQLEIEKAERDHRQKERRRKPLLEPPSLTYMTDFSPDELPMGVLMDLGVEPELGSSVSGLYPIVVRAEFLNNGDKAADQMLASITVPASVTLLLCGPRGEHVQRIAPHPVDSMTLRGDGEESARRHGWRIEHMPPHQPEATHLMLLLPNQQEYEVVVQAEHPDAEAVQDRFLVSHRAVSSAPDRTQNPASL
jgi:hypothetical protein